MDAAPGSFIVERVNAKIGALERRAEHLQRRIKDHSTADRGRSFDITELQAIEAAIVALRVHRALLDPETNPVLALAEMVDAYDADDKNESHFRRWDNALDRARKVLKELREE